MADEAQLEAELAEAKEVYRANTDDEGAKQRLYEAKQAIVQARAARRSAGVTVGGDATITNQEG